MNLLVKESEVVKMTIEITDAYIEAIVKTEVSKRVTGWFMQNKEFLETALTEEVQKTVKKEMAVRRIDICELAKQIEPKEFAKTITERIGQDIAHAFADYCY